MLPALPPRRPGRVLAAVLAALVSGVFLTAPVRAADPGDSQSSLKLIPADAAFYSTMLRNKEQVDAVAKSKAWAKLWALPSVQQGWKALEAQYSTPGGSLAALHQVLETDENKELLALLGDAVSDEVFVYGDDKWVGFVDLAQQMNTAMQYQPLIAQLEDKAGGRPADVLQGRAVLSVLAKNTDLIKIPDLVLGFKVSDAKRAEKQIKRLEALAEQLAEQSPELKGRVKRTKVGDASFLTLTLEGAQIPWEGEPLKKFEDKPGEFDPVVRKLKALTLTVSLGVRNGYLLLGVGASAEHLAQLGGPGPRLDQQPEFRPLAKFADQKLTSIGYASKAFIQIAAGNLRQLDSLTELAKAGLAKADLTEEQRKAILKDLADAVAGIKRAQPEAGAAASFSFMTDRGFEGYSYDHGKHSAEDGSKPLTLLNHLGGNPLAAVVGRTKTSVADYENLVKGLQTAYVRIDEIARSKLTGDDKEHYIKMSEDLLPLLKRLDEATDKMFLPALADGQTALVLDAKWTSKRWIKSLPVTEKALPAPEFGIVLGVSDADLLRKALAEYRTVLNDAIAKAKTWPGGDKIGDFQIPEPKSKKIKTGTLYYYPLPPEWGLDAKVGPAAGLSDDVAALALSQGHATRLLNAKPLKVDGGPLAEKDSPLAAATYLDWAGMVDALTPWVEFGTAKLLDSQAGGEAPEKTRDAVLGQVKTVLEVLKCWRGETSATTVEDGVLITHRESVFRDLEK